MTNADASAQATSGRKPWREELAHALAQPELTNLEAGTDESQRAAYWLTVALGACRLRGVDLGTLDGSLPGSVVLAAGRRMLTHLADWIAAAGALSKRLDDADGVVEVNDLCFDVLESRMEAWAAFVAIDEGYQACLVERSHLRTEVAGLIDQLVERMASLDRVMQEQVPFLTLVARYPFLENQRLSLAAEYANPLPWWLDGRLEEEVARIAREPGSWLPRKLKSRPEVT